MTCGPNRDGVSEGQFKAVGKDEVKVIKGLPRMFIYFDYFL